MKKKRGGKSRIIQPTRQQIQKVSQRSASPSIEELAKRSSELESLSAASEQIKDAQAKMAQQRAMHEEFRLWKESLLNMITRGARLVQYQDGSYEFLLPSKLVRVVWQVTLKERVRMAMADGGTPADAIAKLQDEFADAVGTVLNKVTPKEG